MGFLLKNEVPNKLSLQHLLQHYLLILLEYLFSRTSYLGFALQVSLVKLRREFYHLDVRIVETFLTEAV